MAGRNVNVYIGKWTDDEVTVPVPCYSVDIKIYWTDEDGQQRHHSGTYQFPNVLAMVPRERLRAYMEELILCEARIQLGIDEEE